MNHSQGKGRACAQTTRLVQGVGPGRMIRKEGAGEGRRWGREDSGGRKEMGEGGGGGG